MKKQAMTFDEYKEAVYKELMKYAVAKAYPCDAKKVLQESEKDVYKYYKQGDHFESTACGLSLLI